jgi:hypothetical protein
VNFSSRAASATAMNTLHNFSLFQLRFGHPADAVRSEIGVAGLDASKAAQVLVAGFLPLSDKIGISDFLFETIFVEFSADDLSANVHVEDISGFLMVDLEDGPKRLVNSFTFVWLGFGLKKLIFLKRLQIFEHFLPLPSRIFCSMLSKVSSIRSHPSGGRFLLLLTLGIFITYLNEICLKLFCVFFYFNDE